MAKRLYPESDTNDVLREESENRLKLLLEPRMRVRFERDADVGGDGTIEWRDGRANTNLRAQFQLKATSHARPNADGCIPLRVETQNIRYLSNHFPSIYILYTQDEQIFYRLWIDECLPQLAGSRLDWMEQETVTIHFAERLDVDLLARDLRIRAALASRIQQVVVQGRILARPVSLLIDPDRFEATTEHEIADAITTSATGLICSGRAQQVIELGSKLSHAMRRAPRISLLLAWAHQTCGDYLDALSLVRGPPGQDLDANESVLWRLIEVSTKLILGLIDQARYQFELDELAHSNVASALRLQIALESARRRTAAARGEAITAIESEVQEIRQRIARVNDPTGILSASVNAVAHEIEGILIEGRIIASASQVQMGATLGALWAAEEGTASLHTAREAFRGWAKKTDHLRERARELRLPWIEARLIYTHAWVLFGEMQMISDNYFCRSTTIRSAGLA